MTKNQEQHQIEQAEAAAQKYLNSIGMKFETFEKADDVTKIFILQMAKLDIERKANLREISKDERSVKIVFVIVFLSGMGAIIASLL